MGDVGGYVGEKFIDENNHGKWKKVMEKKFKVGNNLSIFHCNLSDNMARGHLRNTFGEETLKAWQKVVGETNVNGELVLDQSHWFNRRLNLEAHPSMSKKLLLRHGLLRIKDVYLSEEGRLMTHSELRN